MRPHCALSWALIFLKTQSEPVVLSPHLCFIDVYMSVALICRVSGPDSVDIPTDDALEALLKDTKPGSTIHLTLQVDGLMANYPCLLSLLLSISDFVSDILFIDSLSALITSSSSSSSSSPISLYRTISTAIVICSYSASLLSACYITFFGSISKDKQFRAWIAQPQNKPMVSFAVVTSGFGVQNLKLINSHILCGMQLFSANWSTAVDNALLKLSIIALIMEDIPQFLIQVLVSIDQSSVGAYTLVAMAFTAYNIAIGVTTVFATCFFSSSQKRGGDGDCCDKRRTPNCRASPVHVEATLSHLVTTSVAASSSSPSASPRGKPVYDTC